MYKKDKEFKTRVIELEQIANPEEKVLQATILSIEMISSLKLELQYRYILGPTHNEEHLFSLIERVILILYSNCLEEK